MRVGEGRRRFLGALVTRWFSLQFVVAQVSFAEPAAGGLTAALTAPFGVRFHWSEAVQEFGPRKVSLDGVGGTLEDWKADADGKTFTATVRPRADGKISVKVGSGGFQGRRRA